jgi:CRISPR-associated helicase Cas3/CRISPR-associated endonuclease Cas3-HD
VVKPWCRYRRHIRVGQPGGESVQLTRINRLLAKSAVGGRPAESLIAHSSATLEAAFELRRRIGRIELAEKVFDDDTFWQAVMLAALLHDGGKIADGFQEMVLGRQRAWGQRHEVLSLGFLPLLIAAEHLRDWVAAGVVTHHRGLTGPIDARRPSIESCYTGATPDDLRKQFGPIDGKLAGELASWFAATAIAAGLPVSPPETPEPDLIDLSHPLLHRVLHRWTRQRHDPDTTLVAVLLQGAVTLADHLSSAHGSLHHTQPISPALTRRLTDAVKGLYPHQVRSGEVRGHLLLRAPTGSGKTEAGLLWAASQVTSITAQTGGVPRVFYVLPYLASINAMTGRLAEMLGDSGTIGVSHSRAASYHLATAIRAEDDVDEQDLGQVARKAVARAAATRLFTETVRVGTPYQLLRGALAGPVHSGILLDSANSVFVLDELHAYEPDRLGFILAAARLWERLGGRIAVLSATLPEALAELLRETLAQPVTTVIADPDQAPARHRLTLRHAHLTDAPSVAEIRDRLASGEAVLVVANNVAHAQQLFTELSPIAQDLYGEDGAILLHSRYQRRHRSAIEARITARYGTEATRRNRRQPGLVVTTQVAEVSLDVDFDVLFTSAAVLEALLQRFGRVNRLGARPPADVIVHAPAYAPRRGTDDEYADGVYPREPTESAWQALLEYDGQIIDETEATDWLDRIYATPWGERWRADVRRKRREFERVFLSFRLPYQDRSDLGESFDIMFDGTEAVLTDDRDTYARLLASTAQRAAGRLLADDYLIPLPGWTRSLARFDRTLGVHLIDGVYTETFGLQAVNRPGTDDTYRPGELI